MNALNIVFLASAGIVLAIALLHFAISKKRIKTGKKSNLWEEVEEDKED